PGAEQERDADEEEQCAGVHRMAHEGVGAAVGHPLTFLDLDHGRGEGVLTKRPPGAAAIEHDAEAAERLKPGRHSREARARGVPAHARQPAAESEDEERRPSAIPWRLRALYRRAHALAQQARAMPGQPEDHRRAAE